MSAFHRLLDARVRFIVEADPPHDRQALLLAPRFEIALRADPSTGWPLAPGAAATIAGIPFAVSKTLPPGVLAVFFTGEPFDPRHPERTVVLREGE